MPPHRPEPPELTTAPERLDVLLASAVRRLCRGAAPEAFLAWFKEAAPQVAPAAFPATMSAAEVAVAAYWLGRSIWNSFPAPENGYRPRPLPHPERSASCPCGSGRKYEHCCEAASEALALDPDWAWSLLFDVLPEKHWLDAAAQGRLPIPVKVMAVAYYNDAGRWKTVMRLVERDLLEGDGRLDPRLGDAVDPLCNAYDGLYRTDRKKKALLTRLVRHPVAHVRAEANLRRGAGLADEGELDQAWKALQEAMRAEPDNPGAAVLELTLLHGAGELDQLKRRADFWHRRFERRADVADGLKELLDRARTDPSEAFEAIERAQIDPDLLTLVECAEAGARRALPAYVWRPLDETDPGRGAPCELVEDPACAAVVRRWREVCPVDKPTATEWTPIEGSDAWIDPDPWLRYVEGHAGVFDSLDAIDDLVSLVFAHEDVSFPVVMRRGVQPLLERAVAIVEASRRRATEGATLPARVPANRPALRLLGHQAILADDASVRAAAMALSVALDPEDSEGWRGPLVNTLLGLGRDAEALAVIEARLDDETVDLLYGKALAHYRLGDEERATVALAEACARAPKVFRGLLNENLPPPETFPHGQVTPGGDDEAWLYREHMRAEWLRTPGLLELMKSLPAKR